MLCVRVMQEPVWLVAGCIVCQLDCSPSRLWGAQSASEAIGDIQLSTQATQQYVSAYRTSGGELAEEHVS